MSDAQEQDFDPSAEEGQTMTDDSLEHSEDDEDDALSQFDLMVAQTAESRTEDSDSAATGFDEHILQLEVLQEASAAENTSPAAPVPAVKTTLKCVLCERTRANERIFTCKSGHLICGKCVQFPTSASFRILPRCPHCNEDAEPNQDAQKQIEELTVKCHYCQTNYKNFYIKDHEKNVCDLRPVRCKYEMGGCNWRGTASAQAEHEQECAVQVKSGEEIMQALEKSQRTALEAALFGMNDLIKLLSQTSCDLVNIRLVKKSPLPTSHENLEFYYESTVFAAANLFWYVKAKIVKERQVQYALKLNSNIRAGNEYQVYYAKLGGTMELKPVLFEHSFNARNLESGFQRLFKYDAEFKNFEAPIMFRLMLSLK